MSNTNSCAVNLYHFSSLDYDINTQFPTLRFPQMNLVKLKIHQVFSKSYIKKFN